MTDTPTPDEPQETRKRRKGLVEIEASPETLALATLLGQEPEQFVADCVRLRSATLAEKIRATVTGGA